MEVNKDEALRCLDIARRHLNSGNYASARKFGNKSVSLFPTPEANTFLHKVEHEEEAGQATTSSTTSTAEHKPVEREYTPEQVAAVKKIRSSGGDFYKVLGVSKDATDADIKKAYRKLALQMHPDKNGAPGADEAFKIVSKAFTVLSDPQKRAIFDQHGPESGRSSGVNYDRASPMGQGFNGMNGFGEEISPEELFNMFFGGGSFGGSFHSATFAGPGFGPRPFRPYTQQTQRQPQQQAQGAGATSGFSSLIQILPLILLFIISLTSNFFSDSDSSSSRDSSPAASDFSLGAHGSYQSARFTSAHHVPYFVNERRFRNTFTKPGGGEKRDVHVLDLNKVINGVKVQQILTQLEENVETTYLKYMRNECLNEIKRKELAHSRAQGFFGRDKKMWEAAERMTTPSCDIIRDKFGSRYMS
ncbi:hypothetical protein BCR41DRAFT_331442 [Lobosporangium transversale]|uniref:J domain-containing protein n=1 Tax=Lobosporangium transversale TaxID=64571 RepID=A0A1Y2H216_9FUNG|nr:hypothetical protein BCR41DRAFT_331442 [Lobosporangium transversale]ORZ27753.1 hypothetical protein BCR41DRAFT_331442 [Lobosporangium transversale]|eukprot:XP_021885456.1 hypothetical protein BCR41DRAFT_331442 [Lobosporangium transversale]